MAFFSQRSSSPKKDNPFAFDIDEQGHSSSSRQRQEGEKLQRADNTEMINSGQHCRYHLCGQLDILPQICDYCALPHCLTHAHPEKHECSEYVPVDAPLCEVCHQFIRIDRQLVTTRAAYDNVVKEHADSKCKLHTFEKSDAEKKAIRDALRCGALGCNNHKGDGKKLSTIVCKWCGVQCCLSHRLPDFHQCASLKNEVKQDSKAEEFQKKVLEKMYGSGVLGESDTHSTNKATERLRQVQQQAHQKLKDSCKNPHLANKSQTGSKIANMNDGDSSGATEKGTKQETLPDASDPFKLTQPVTTIPTRGTLIAHQPIHPVNVRTSVMLAKPKTKNQSNAKIASANKIYCVVYFPHTTVPSTTAQYPEQSVPFSLQSNLNSLNSTPFSSISNNSIPLPPSVQPSPSPSSPQSTTEVNSASATAAQKPTLFFSDVYLPHCTASPSATSTAILTNNAKLAAPLYVALDKNWTINQCLDEITTYAQLPPPSLLKKTFSNNVIYTLSMSYLPIAPFIPSLTLGEVLDRFENDFNAETQLLHASHSAQSTRTTPTQTPNATPPLSPQNPPQGSITPPITSAVPTKHKPKSALDRENAAFAPLHISLGWYIENR